MKLTQAARSYLGVRFRHRGRRDTGVDCVGLGIRAYHDCGVELPDFQLYGREPHQDGLIERITAALGPPIAVGRAAATLLQVDDVAVFRFVREPHHVGLITPYPYGGLALIHADGHNGKVVEHRLSADMVARITHLFRRPV